MPGKNLGATTGLFVASASRQCLIRPLSLTGPQISCATKVTITKRVSLTPVHPTTGEEQKKENRREGKDKGRYDRCSFYPCRARRTAEPLGKERAQTKRLSTNDQNSSSGLPSCSVTIRWQRPRPPGRSKRGEKAGLAMAASCDTEAAHEHAAQRKPPPSSKAGWILLYHRCSSSMQTTDSLVAVHSAHGCRTYSR
jgi:hypothetical protein